MALFIFFNITIPVSAALSCSLFSLTVSSHTSAESTSPCLLPLTGASIFSSHASFAAVCLALVHLWWQGQSLRRKEINRSAVHLRHKTCPYRTYTNMPIQSRIVLMEDTKTIYLAKKTIVCVVMLIVYKLFAILGAKLIHWRAIGPK